MPLLGPLLLLVAGSRQAGHSSAVKPSQWLMPCIHALIGATLFGFILQGGLMPALLNSEEALASTESIPGRVIFWRVPTVPSYLILPTVEPDSRSLTA